MAHKINSSIPTLAIFLTALCQSTDAATAQSNPQPYVQNGSRQSNEGISDLNAYRDLYGDASNRPDGDLSAQNQTTPSIASKHYAKTPLGIEIAIFFGISNPKGATQEDVLVYAKTKTEWTPIALTHGIVPPLGKICVPYKGSDIYSFISEDSDSITLSYRCGDPTDKRPGESGRVKILKINYANGDITDPGPVQIKSANDAALSHFREEKNGGRTWYVIEDSNPRFVGKFYYGASKRGIPFCSIVRTPESNKITLDTCTSQGIFSK